MKKALAVVALLLLTACSPSSSYVKGEVVSCKSISQDKTFTGGVTMDCLDRSEGAQLGALRGPMVVNVWGSWCGPCKEEIPFLHYELCYYQAIEFAINNGYKRVEAGAQGEHKIARGYQPVKIYSAHIFQDLALNSAVKGYVEKEKQLLESIIQNQNSALPFRI
jgi:hypothetical protein